MTDGTSRGGPRATARRLLAAAERIQAVIEALARLAACLAALAVVGITALLVVSSIKRYLFSTPIPETEELSSLLFLAMSVLAIPCGLYRGRHVRLDLAWRHLPIRWRLGLEAIGLVVACLALGLLVRETLLSTFFAYQIGARTDMNEIRIWPWQLLLPAGLVLFLAGLAARAAVVGLRLAAGRLVDEPPGAADAGGLQLH